MEGKQKWHPARIVLRRLRQGLYGGCALSIAAVLTESFVQRWGSTGVYAGAVTALLLAIMGLVVEIIEASAFKEEYDD